MPLFGPVGDDWPPQCQVNMQMSLRGAPAWSLAWKGLFCRKGGYCPCQCFQPLSNVTFGAALPRLAGGAFAGGASAKQRSANKGKTLLWEESVVAARPGADFFPFFPPQ